MLAIFTAVPVKYLKKLHETICILFGKKTPNIIAYLSTPLANISKWCVPIKWFHENKSMKTGQKFINTNKEQFHCKLLIIFYGKPI